MKTAPITPGSFGTGEIGTGEIGTGPAACDGAALDAAVAHARRMLAANGLPARWRHRQRFVILETGFGIGAHFLAAWQAWRDDPQRCRHLHIVSLEPHPPTQATLRRAHAASATPELAATLVDAWPELTPNVHALDFDGGRVQLLLAFGDVAALLAVLRAQADAIHLGCSSAGQEVDPRWLKALGRRAAADATLAGNAVPHAAQAELRSTGFAVDTAAGDQPTTTTARFAPRATVRVRSAAPSAGPQDAIVIGAGIAGAAMAEALARNGVVVRVLDRHAEPAQEASGNPVGLFHGTVHASDGVHARLFRAAALHAQRAFTDALRAGVPGSTGGVLRLGTDLPAMQAVLQAQRLPPGYVQALDAACASQHAGVPVSSPAWFYPGGGWISPADWIRLRLRQPGIAFAGGTAVARIDATQDAQGRVWHLHDAQDHVLARTRLLVLANAADAGRLLQPLGHGPWPLQQIRGQTTWWTQAQEPSALRMPLAGDGYAIPLPDGGLLCGATREAVAPSASAAALRPAEHAHNVQGFERLSGLSAPDSQHWQGRVGWRLQADDRLPVAGAVPLSRMPHGQRLDQARLLPREDGLFVLTALGARGLTLAPLLARMVAAQATGAPWPLEQDLVDAIDPGRWTVRAARQGVTGGRNTALQ